MKNLKRSALGLSFLIALLCLHGCGGADVKKNSDGSTSIARGIAPDTEVVERDAYAPHGAEILDAFSTEDVTHYAEIGDLPK